MDRIERLMATWEPRIAAAFRLSIQGIRNKVVIAQLVEALKAGDVERAVRLIGIEPVRFRPLAAVLEAFFEAAGMDTTVSINVGPGVGLAIFDVRDPPADNWLRTHATELITRISDEQRDMVREALRPLRLGVDPMLSMQTPQKLALDLVGRISSVTRQREGGMIGLNAEQAKWARNYAAELAESPPNPGALERKLRDKRFDRTIAKAIREERSLTDEQRQAMVFAYRNRALRLRGETIALNEASEVAHNAQVEAWKQAITRGVVKEDSVRRFWITAGDDQVRPTHREVPGLNAAGVRLDQPFQTYKGPVMQPGWRFDPGCRCRVRVRVVE
jgi:hypothetical protein